jgi:hypothetical protein
MDPMKLELVIELAVVLSAPPIYQYYLWRRGKFSAQHLRSSIKIFVPLYLLVIGFLVVLLRQSITLG